MSDRLTGVHHSLAQKNQQHDGCTLLWHLQPEPQSWLKSTPLRATSAPYMWVCVCVCVCAVTDIQDCRALHVSSTHHSVWWNKVNQHGVGPYTSSSFSILLYSSARMLSAKISNAQTISGCSNNASQQNDPQFRGVQVWWQVGPRQTLELN